MQFFGEHFAPGDSAREDIRCRIGDDIREPHEVKNKYATRGPTNDGIAANRYGQAKVTRGGAVQDGAERVDECGVVLYRMVLNGLMRAGWCCPGSAAQGGC